VGHPQHRKQAKEVVRSRRKKDERRIESRRHSRKLGEKLQPFRAAEREARQSPGRDVHALREGHAPQPHQQDGHNREEAHRVGEPRSEHGAGEAFPRVAGRPGERVARDRSQSKGARQQQAEGENLCDQRGA